MKTSLFYTIIPLFFKLTIIIQCTFVPPVLVEFEFWFFWCFFQRKEIFMTSHFVNHFEFFVRIQISPVSKFSNLSEYIQFPTLIYKNHCSIEHLMTTCEIFFSFCKMDSGSKGLTLILDNKNVHLSLYISSSKVS